MRPRWLFILVAVAFAGYSAFWMWGARRLEEQLKTWMAAQKSKGLEVESQNIAIAGFPFFFQIKIDNPYIAQPGHPHHWSFSTDRLVVLIRPWSFHKGAMTSEGIHRLRWVEGSEPYSISAEQPLWRLSFRLDDQWQPSQIDSDYDRPVIKGPWFQGQAIKVNKAEFHWRVAPPVAETKAPDTAPTSEFQVVLEEITLPQATNLLGDKIWRFATLASINGAPPAGFSTEQLAEWRDRGGNFEIRPSSLIEWGPIKAEVNGNLTLDQSFRPLGAGHAKIIGFEALFDLMVEQGKMQKFEAGLATAALGILAKKQPDGKAQLEAPLTAQDGQLSLGPVPIIRLGPVR